MRRAALLVALLMVSMDGGSRAASVARDAAAQAGRRARAVDSTTVDNLSTDTPPSAPSTYAQPLAARAPDSSSSSSSGVKDLAFNYTFSDMSPILNYIGQDWTNSFSDSSTPTSGSVFGQGRSGHTAAVPNTPLTFSFVGTGVYIFGEPYDPKNSTDPTNAAILMAVDSVNVNYYPNKMPDNLLAFKDKLPYGKHDVSFYLTQGTVTIRNVTILGQLSTEAPSASEVKTTKAVAYDGKAINSAFDISGDWFPVGSIGGDDNTVSESLPVLNGRPGSTLTYSIPANSTYIVLNGITQPTSTGYSVLLSPSPPGGDDNPFTATALRSFTNPAVFFISPLDPNESYNLTLRTSGTTGVIGLDSIVTYSSVWSKDNSTSPGTSTSPGGSSSTSSPGGTSTSDGATQSGGAAAPSKSKSVVGPIVGGVVGGVAGLLLIALAVFLCLRRRKSRAVKPRHPPDDNFVIDDDVQATPYPYEMTQTQQEQARQRMSLLSDSSTTPLTDPVPYPPGSRGVEQGGIVGFTPRSPASPTLTASTMLTTTNMLGLGVVNGDPREELATNSRDPAMASYNIAAQKRAAAARAAQDPFHPPQERDAGRWDLEAEDALAAMKTVPPSYDPSWAGDYSDANTTVAGTVYDEPLSRGPSMSELTTLGRNRDSQRTVDMVEELDENESETGDKGGPSGTSGASAKTESPKPAKARVPNPAAGDNDNDDENTTTKTAKPPKP